VRVCIGFKENFNFSANCNKRREPSGSTTKLKQVPSKKTTLNVAKKILHLPFMSLVVDNHETKKKR